jgi:hypothetical protein
LPISAPKKRRRSINDSSSKKPSVHDKEYLWHRYDKEPDEKYDKLLANGNESRKKWSALTSLALTIAIHPFMRVLILGVDVKSLIPEWSKKIITLSLTYHLFRFIENTLVSVSIRLPI